MEKTISQEVKFKGRLLELRVLEVEVGDRVSKREIVYHPGASAVLVLKDDKVLLVRQYRKAIEGYTWEIPAGKLGPSEDPLSCIVRELEEETGIKVSRGQLKFLGKIHTTPGFTNEVIYIYLLQLSEEPHLEPQDQEEIKAVRWFSFDELKTMIHEGKLTDSKTLASLTLWKVSIGQL